MRRVKGFTLLEMLVVLSLLGVLLTLLASALTNATRALASADRFSARLDEVRATHTFLRHAIGQALPLPAVIEPKNAGQIFLGEAQRLSVVAPLPNSLGGGIFKQTVELENHRLRVTFFNADIASPSSHGEPQTLLSNIRKFSFGYRGLSPDRKNTGWLTQWPWPNHLPQAVRITMDLDGSVPWTTQEVSLRLDLSTDGSGL